LTGHPIEYPLQALKLAFLAVGAHETQRTMVSELQPFNGDYLALIVLGGLLGLRALANLKTVPLTRDPAFWLACMTWVLAFKVAGFWTDWGWPALMVMIAWDLQSLMQTRQAADAPQRLVLVCVLGAATYLGITSDFNSRWSSTLTQQFLSTTDHPELEGW